MTARPGFALIGALWLMVAVSAAATAFAFSARSHRLAVANTTESVQARQAALSALQLLLSRLDERVARANAIPLGMPPEPNPWRDLTEILPPQLEIGPAVAHIEILDSGAKLNLNTASAGELTRFFIALGESPANSERLAENIIDWRDPDLIREDGAQENSAYEAADAPRLPANAPFEDARDLQFVLGINAELFEKAREHITATGHGRISIHAASAPVLLALAGFSPEAVASIEARRGDGQRFYSLLELALTLPFSQQLQLTEHIPDTSARTTLTVDGASLLAIGTVPGSPVRVVLDATIQRTPEGARATEITWR